MQQSRNVLCACGSKKKYKLCCGSVVIQELKKPAAEKFDVAILMPTRGSMSVETHNALQSNMSGCKCLLANVARKSVVQARNELATEALNLQRNGYNVEFVLWVERRQLS